MKNIKLIISKTIFLLSQENNTKQMISAGTSYIQNWLNCFYFSQAYSGRSLKTYPLVSSYSSDDKIVQKLFFHFLHIIIYYKFICIWVSAVGNLGRKASPDIFLHKSMLQNKIKINNITWCRRPALHVDGGP